MTLVRRGKTPRVVLRVGPGDGSPPRRSGSTPREAPKRRTFPWGDDYNPHLANHGAGGVPLPLDFDETDASDGFTYLAPVGSFPDGATPLGVLDMAGQRRGVGKRDFWGDSDENGYGYSRRSRPWTREGRSRASTTLRAAAPYESAAA